MNAPRRPLHESLRAPLQAGDAERLWRRIEARRRDPARVRAAAPVVVLVCAAAAAALLLAPRAERSTAASVAERPAPAGDGARSVPGAIGVDTRRPPPVAAEVGAAAAPAREPLRWANGAPLSSVEVLPGAPARTLALSDGTRVSLAAGTRLSTRAATRERTELALDRGGVRFEVQPQRARSFAVVSAGLRVEVVGTIFSVERARDSARVEVEVEHGRVRVHAPDLPAAGVLLEAGQRLAWPAPTAAHEPAPTARAPVRAGQPGFTDARAPVRSAQPALTDGRASVRARRPAATDAGVLASQLPDDPRALLALADAARIEGRPAQAALALARIVVRHPESEHAPLAALTLGRLQLDALHQPVAAARTLRRALDLGLPQGLHEDALARLVQAHADARDGEAARRAASEYRARFPRGRWRASVDAWSASER
jgi:hypothetical protein